MRVSCGERNGGSVTFLKPPVVGVQIFMVPCTGQGGWDEDNGGSHAGKHSLRFSLTMGRRLEHKVIRQVSATAMPGPLLRCGGEAVIHTSGI